MKRQLFQLFNLLMACIVLLSSTGFGLVEHSCQMRGKKKIMVVAFSKSVKQTGCKIGKHDTVSTDELTISREECCKDDSRYENVDVSSSLTQLVAKFAKIVTEAVLTSVITVVTWLVDWIFDRSVATPIPSVSAPTLPSGRDLLSLIQRLLI